MRRDDAYLLDMLMAAREAIELSAGLTLEALETDRIAQHAMARLVQIIGEAARNVSEDGRAALPEIPWRDVVGMRHILVHEYFRIDVPAVYSVLRDDLPDLVGLLSAAVPPEDDAPGSAPTIDA